MSISTKGENWFKFYTLDSTQFPFFCCFHSLTYLFPHSLTHALTQSLSHSLTHPTHSLTHSYQSSNRNFKYCFYLFYVDGLNVLFQICLFLKEVTYVQGYIIIYILIGFDSMQEQRVELQEKKVQKDYRMQEISLERTYS